MTLEQEVEHLRQENASLREHVRLLQEKIALQDQLLKEQEALLKQVDRLQERVHSLERQLRKDSHNSHLPPSSDRFHRQPKSLRQKTGKKAGGQAGHPGQHLMFSSQPDQVISHEVKTCSHCHADLQAVPASIAERRQVIDLPVPHMVVFEYQIEQKDCPQCGKRSRAQFADNVRGPVQYGPTIQALAISFSQVSLLPSQRVCDLFADVFDLHFSVGSLHNWIEQCAEQLAPVEQAIKTAFQQAEVMHQDETGLYVKGKRAWMHVCCTATLTHYAMHPKRGREAIDAIGILPAFEGVSVHDGWESYQGYLCQHALCNVHHLRELTGLLEDTKQDWVAEMIDLLLQMKDCVEQAKAAGHQHLSSELEHSFLQQYQSLLRLGYASIPADPPPKAHSRGCAQRSPAHRLLDRLCSKQQQVLAFLTNFAVPFDNSQAERDIRMVKVQQKVSGCFRSDEGAHAFCRLRGYFSTMRKQGHRLLGLLEAALSGYPVFPAF